MWSMNHDAISHSLKFLFLCRIRRTLASGRLSSIRRWIATMPVGRHIYSIPIVNYRVLRLSPLLFSYQSLSTQFTPTLTSSELQIASGMLTFIPTTVSCSQDVHHFDLRAIWTLLTVSRIPTTSNVADSYLTGFCSHQHAWVLSSWMHWKRGSGTGLIDRKLDLWINLASFQMYSSSRSEAILVC